MALGGLSLGAALTATTMGLSPPGLFTKEILMSPFLGISYQGADEIIYKCSLNTQSFKDCLPFYFNSIGFNISSDDSQELSQLIIDSIGDYVDVNMAGGPPTQQHTMFFLLTLARSRGSCGRGIGPGCI